MNDLKVLGKEKVAGFEFTGIEGGFGEGKKAMLVKDIAKIHNSTVKRINELINRNRKQFIDDVDIVDLKVMKNFEVVQNDLGFSQGFVNRSNHIYLLSERGYLKLLKIMDDDKAWDIYNEIVDNYFNMRVIIREQVEIPSKFNIPQTLPEALRLAADQAEQLAKQKPKVDYYDSMLRNPGLMTVTEMAKDYGWSARTMNEKLHEMGIQYKQGDHWVLYAKYADKGYAQSEPFPYKTNSRGRKGVKNNLKWTQRGRKFVYDELAELGIYPVLEQMDLLEGGY